MFTLVINALLLMVTSFIGTRFGIGFTIDDFLSALLGAIVISLFSFVLSIFIRGGRPRRA